MPLIEAKNLSVSYAGKKVIENVSFKIEEGDFLCIAGENGTGKTTLLKVLTSLKKADGGTLHFNKNLKKKHIGYLPQQTDVQRDFPAGVKEVILSAFLGGMGFMPFYRASQTKKLSEIMEKLEITELSKKCYHELSGGQQQRVLLARALCAAKKLLILDEPTSALDSSAVQDFYRIISELSSKGMTVIMISHDIENAVKYASKVLHLGESEMLYFGSSEEYIKSFTKSKGGEE
ncbi:MAG: ABC transporter ATP-binding protein [Clostridia bacterium]|nr:ABC transporter ATP-binding protein [Clostridia bacterium]MBO7289196.1 ABC transporter ATP-binding protein [Clostridia bacterium]